MATDDFTFNITVENGGAITLDTEGKYVDRDIVLNVANGLAYLTAYNKDTNKIATATDISWGAF